MAGLPDEHVERLSVCAAGFFGGRLQDRQLQFVIEHVGKLLGRVDVEFVADFAVDLLRQRFKPQLDLATHLLEHVTVADHMPASRLYT